MLNAKSSAHLQYLETGTSTVALLDRGTPDKRASADAVVVAKPDAPLGYFNEVVWTPTLPATGLYEVKAWWPGQPGIASSEVWFNVHHRQGKTKVVKNQTLQSGQWVSLGQFTLDPASANVTLSDYGVAGQRVFADAVSFTRIDNSPLHTVYYVHSDHLNTPRQLTTSDAANTVVWRWDSEPFGSTLPDQDPDQNGQMLSYNLRFPGQYYDAETQLSYNYFRDYDPATGRYIESDPIGLKAGLNTYAYVNGNPIGAVDPSGLIKWTGTMLGAAGFRGALGRGEYTFKLSSPCVNGQKWRVQVRASATLAGLGWPGSLAGASVTLEDGLSSVDPYVFNGQFSFWGFGASWGGGYGYSEMALGGAYSPGSRAPYGGLDYGISGGTGPSWVTSAEPDNCECKK